jgi:hypothetical protein
MKLGYCYESNTMMLTFKEIVMKICIKCKQKKENYKSASVLKLIGCSIEQLKEHLQQTAIKNGYSDFDINTYSGKEYHIDHIIPCSAFNLKCSYHQKLCFNYLNTQILESKENILKSNK